jgi:streptogramin lyase
MRKQGLVESNRSGEFGSAPAILPKLVAIAAFAIAIGGCGGSSSSYTPKPKVLLSGAVYGGAAGNPIIGAQIAVYQAGATGYGAGSVQLATTTSGKDGGFKFRTLGCQSGEQLYLVATGGAPSGQSAANAAIALSAAIGPCGANRQSVVINEVTTVATVWALNQFTDSTGQNIGTTASNPAGLNNAAAVLTALSLVDLSTGLVPAVLPLGVVPTSGALYSLANILATCVDSSGATSSECQDLFSDATPPGGTAPTTTLEAAVDMARNPGNNVSALFSLIPANPPFTPDLTSAPDSWALAIEYDPAGAELSGPYKIAIDATGNVWVADAGGNSVTMLDAAAGYVTGSVFGPSGAGLLLPTGIAIDLGGNVWVSNFDGDTISELTAASNYSTGLNFAPTGAAFNSPLRIALDASGNVWAGNYDGDSMSELTASSNYATGLNFAPAGAVLDYPTGIAVDSQSNVWAANYASNSVSELTASSNYGTGFNFAPAGASINSPLSLALDSNGNVWVANRKGDSVSELLAGNYTSGNNFSPTGAAIYGPIALALDSANNLWVANVDGNNLSELTAASAYTTGLSFMPFSDDQGQFAMALDASGNVWVANNYGDTVSQFLGLANPVLTPIQACLAKGHDVCVP